MLVKANATEQRKMVRISLPGSRFSIHPDKENTPAAMIVARISFDIFFIPKKKTCVVNIEHLEKTGHYPPHLLIYN